ncbi:hypothetical protein Taro_004233 [Colocasia esculenta]|uniref:Uncharacterized protein n=1 Tax=Colocasia esculenta TaxID=4460 RepID=A0A843TJF1_COLES|nr:hypothetical protein [Colocasia esculenta]
MDVGRFFINPAITPTVKTFKHNSRTTARVGSERVPTDTFDWRRNGSGSGCQQLLSSQNQFLGSEHYLSKGQGRLSTGEGHLLTDQGYLSTTTGGSALYGFWKQESYRQLNLRLSTHPHRSLQDVEDQ